MKKANTLWTKNYTCITLSTILSIIGGEAMVLPGSLLVFEETQSTFLSAIIMVINQKFFISGFKSLLHKSPNMDTLVAMGSGASFLYSTYALFAMSDAVTKGDMILAHEYMHEFYF